MKSMEADVVLAEAETEVMDDASCPAEDTPPAEDSSGEQQQAEEKSSKPAREPIPEPDEDFCARLEAVLLSLDKPATSGRLAEWLKIGVKEGGARFIRAAVKRLNEQYEASGRSFRIEKVAGGWQIRTLGEFADDLAVIRKRRNEGKLSQAALETLAIVAYRQPVLRADIEAIRGVACGEVLRSLMERRLIKIVGRAEELGRPMLYGTTKHFLEVFGLAGLKDLPRASELRPG